MNQLEGKTLEIATRLKKNHAVTTGEVDGNAYGIISAAQRAILTTLVAEFTRREIKAFNSWLFEEATSQNSYDGLLGVCMEYVEFDLNG